ncbi:MAG: hypothetical protein M1820_009047 [Bogoriella megaspora]|nr:MAG: hypothetical protein M1820_009047 [Bogoriella megaspora]
MIDPPSAPSSTTTVARSSARRARSTHSSNSTQPEPRSLALRTSLKNYKDIATILVGPSHTQFLLHKDLLTSVSPFFSACFSGSFSESTSQTVTLPEEPLPSFEYFAQWLYTRTLEHDMTNNKGMPTYFVILELYALADRLHIEALRNDCCDRMAELAEATNSVPTPSDTWILHERIRDGAPMRKLVGDLFAFKRTDNLLATHDDEWHPRFLRALVVQLKRPAPVAVSRHLWTPWKGGRGEGAAACDVCKAVCKAPPSSATSTAQPSSFKCTDCERVLCAPCLGRGVGGCGWDWPKDGACKPWIRDMCQYHEHGVTEQCREPVTRPGEGIVARVS